MLGCYVAAYGPAVGLMVSERAGVSSGGRGSVWLASGCQLTLFVEGLLQIFDIGI